MQEKDLLRFMTCGSVDDGKSTLIGRLLKDTNNIPLDQLEYVKEESKRRGKEFDLSLVTDGLLSEREQGITIDVAYRYFETSRRKFILADSPGHFEFTKNMITAASVTNLVLILIDARNGVVEQTKRHAFIASLLLVPHVVVCINKMDAVNFREDVFNKIVNDFSSFATRLQTKDIQFIPVSAKHGDNVVARTGEMNWYNGPTLMHVLDNVHTGGDVNHIDTRLPVQLVMDGKSGKNIFGRLVSGILREEEEVVIYPSGKKSVLKQLYCGENKIEEVFAPMSFRFQLKDPIDIKRGDVVLRRNNVCQTDNQLNVMLCWMNTLKMNNDAAFYLRIGTQEVSCKISEILYKIDINSLSRIKNVNSFAMNDIGRVIIETDQIVCFDAYAKNKSFGSFILIDKESNETFAGGILL